MAKRITIKEIAKLAEVSIGTVDRVLHNRGRVALKTREVILKIAKEGNYTSNVYARNLKLNRTYKIGILLPEGLSYWEKHRKGIQKAIKEQESMGFVGKTYPIQNGERISESVMKELIKDAPDGLILTPQVLSLDGNALNVLKQSKTPFVFVDANMQNAGNIAFIGQDGFQSGMLCGALLDQTYAENYQLVVITNQLKDLANNAIVSRMEGLRNYHEKNHRNNITLHELNMERDAIELNDLPSKLASFNSQIRLFVPNSQSHLFAKILASFREKLKLRFVGFDLVHENVACLENGSIDFIIHQQPITQGNLAVQALYKHLILNTPIDEVQYLPLDIITKENLMYCEY